MQDRHPSSQQNEQGINANYLLQVGASILLASVTMLIIWKKNATILTYLGYVTDNGVTRAIKARLTHFGGNNTQKPASTPIIKPATAVDETPKTDAADSKSEIPDGTATEVSAVTPVTLLPEESAQPPEVVEDDEDYENIKSRTTVDGKEKEVEAEVTQRPRM